MVVFKISYYSFIFKIVLLQIIVLKTKLVSKKKKKIEKNKLRESSYSKSIGLCYSNLKKNFHFIFVIYSNFFSTNLPIFFVFCIFIFIIKVPVKKTNFSTCS